MKKKFVLDTSVLIHDPSAIYNFDEHDVFLSYVTILEIDGLRKVPNGRGQAAREFIRQLDSLSQKSPTLVNVTLGENKGDLSVSMLGIPGNLDVASEIPKAFRDDVIIQCAKELQKSHENVILVSKDVGQRIKSAINSIPAQDYLNTKIKNWDQHYTGLHSETLVLPPLKNGDPYKDIIPAPDYLYHNEFCHVKFENYDNVAPILCRKKWDRLILVPDFKTGVQGIYPIDEYQRMAFDVLLDPEVLIVAISGLAGSGKSLMSIAAAIEAYENSKIETIMYVKPIIPVGGRDLGYLPGDKEEKLMNWAKPFYDNLKVIEMAKGKKYGGDMFSDPALNVELEAYTFMRGRTFHNSWVICDEMQNTNILEARTALSRMGEKSKCVILADLTQIDNPYTDAESCGFSVAVESLKDHPIFAAVPLIRSKRSEISKLIAERMNPKN
jgi:PhoH-like ATPase